MKRLLFVPLLSAAVLAGSDARAQEPSPAQSLRHKGQVTWPPVNGSSRVVIAPQRASPSGDPSDAPGAFFPRCRRYDLTVLRNDVENRRQLVETAVMRRGTASDVCRLIGDYRTAMKKMIGFAEINGAACGASTFADKLKIGLKAIESQRASACSGRAWAEDRPAPGPTGDFYPTRLLDMPDGQPLRAPPRPSGNVFDTLPK